MNLLPCEEHEPAGDPLCPFCIALAEPKVEDEKYLHRPLDNA